MADGYNIDELRAAGLSEADIAELVNFDIGKYQATYQANAKAAEDARARGLTAAQATGLSDRYVALNDPRSNDLIGGGINEQIMGRLGLIPQSYDYAPVFNIKGDQDYEDYNFVPVPGKTYRLIDNNTGQVIGTATNATEAKGLAEAANAISQQMGGNANWALQEYGSWSDGKGNMTSGYSDVYTNKKTGFVNDISMLVQAAGIMTMAAGGLAALTTQTAAAAGAGAATTGATTGSLVSTSSLAANTAANLSTISNIAASQVAQAGLTKASQQLLTQIGMGALRGGVTTAAFGGDPIEGAITGGFTALGSTVLGPAIQSFDDAGKVATNLGSSVAGGIGNMAGNLVLGRDLEDSFVSGLVSGATQYVSAEVAEEIDKARYKSAQEAIDNQITKVNNVLSASKLSEGDLDFARSLGDEIIVNAPKFAKEYAQRQVADYLAGLASSATTSGEKADTGTQTQTDSTGTQTAGIADLSEVAQENIRNQIEAIQDNLLITGTSPAGVTAANNAINDLIVNARAKYGDRGENFVRSYVQNGIAKIINVTATDTRRDTDTTAGIGNVDLTATAPTGAPTTSPTGATTVAGIGGLDITATAPTTATPTSRPFTSLPPTPLPSEDITATATTAPPTSRPTSLPPTPLPSEDITATATTSPPTSRPTSLPPTPLPSEDITATATTSPPTSRPTPPPTPLPSEDITATATTSPPTSRPTPPPTPLPSEDITATATTSPPTSRPTSLPPTPLPSEDITATATTSPPTSRPTPPPTPTPTNEPTRPPTTGEPTRPPTWGTQDWIMLGLAVPNLVNRIVGRGEDVGTITPDRSAVTYAPLNRERGIGSFNPFTYGQAGAGNQTAEFEFFKPYSAAQPQQTSTPASVTWTPGGNIYEYDPETFSSMKADAAATYNQRSAAFNNYQQMLAKQVESGAMTLAEAQREARAYAEPYGGAIIQQKADGGYIGYADGGEMNDDMVKHLLEYRKGGGHQGPGQVKGIGSGQEDKIPAWLSDGEYVWSAQDVADLGDGSTDEGVRRLDKMRQMVRKQAGRKDVKKIAKPQKGIDQMLKAVGGKV